jgi:general secretion pathway protein A
MYLDYWQLNQRPFEPTSDARFHYPAEAQQAAVLKLRYAIENRRGAVLLAGPGGSGKSLLLSLLERNLAEEFAPFVRLVFPQMPTADLLAYLADELGAEPCAGPRPAIEQSVRRIQTCLSKNAEQGRHAIVAVDEAHLLDDHRTLESLRLLLNFESGDRPLVTFVLAGQPSLISQMARVPQFDERLAAKCLLKSWSLDETHSYVHHRLAAAGCSRPVFDTAALDALHEAARGLPRQINRLADLALLVGFAEELPSIGRAQIEALADELLLAA